MFLANFSNEPISNLLNWNVDKLFYWYVEAVKLHNELNKSEDTAP